MTLKEILNFLEEKLVFSNIAEFKKDFKKNIHIYFLVFVLIYSLIFRFIDPKITAVLIILGGILIITFDFLSYFSIKFGIYTAQHLQKKELNYSWGFVPEKKSLLLELKDLFSFLFHLSGVEYKKYLESRYTEILLVVFVLGDLLFAFKNLDLYSFGVYATLSIFCKLVFIGYYYFHQKLLEAHTDDTDTIFEIFNSFLNLFLTSSTIVFVLLFLASKTFNDIFFGPNFVPYHTTLPFIFLTNISLVVVFSIYKTASKINKKDTRKVLKIYSVFFAFAFIFSNNNSLDSVTYFIVGTSCVLSIFLYNLIVKQPSYIQNNYNHLF